MLEILTEEVTQPLSEEWAAMTFPLFRPLLKTLGAEEQDPESVRPVVCRARAGNKPTGLIVARLPTDVEPAAEILSIFVAPDLRKQGIATYLIGSLEEALIRRGVPSVLGVYMTSLPNIPAIEGMFAKSGFSAPVRRAVIVRTTPEEMSNANWYKRARLPSNCTIFPWSELTPDELETMKRTQAESHWIHPDLEPWNFDKDFDRQSSVGMRRNDEVVGWVINHRASEKMVAFTISFMREDLARRGRIFPLYKASLEQLSGTGTTCTFMTATRFEAMVRFTETRLGPFASFCGETRGVTKELPSLADKALEQDVIYEPMILENFGDRSEWDSFVAANPNGSFFQSWDWGEVQNKMGARTFRIAALAQGRIIGCVQVFLFDSGAKKFTYVALGPVVDADDKRVAGALLEAVVKLSDDQGAFLARIEPPWTDDTRIQESLANEGFVMASQHIMPVRTMLVDLEPPVDAIWSSFRSNTRNRIRLAEKRGVEVRVGKAEDTEAFVQLYEETAARHNLSLATVLAFRLASGLFGPRDAMRVYLASSEGLDIAGIVVFVFGKRATYLWGGSLTSPSARRLNPNQLLNWTAMQWARERGCTAYDMTGIPDYDEEVLEANYSKRSDEWWPLYRFKRGFRGRVHRRVGTFDWLLQQNQPSRDA